jgi:thiol-disulfide isomerase/thioredoxin
MRAPVDTIVAPLFPPHLPRVNPADPQTSILKRGRPMLVEFWDFCRPNSIRTLPYVKAWHERYAGDGLRVIGVHCPGFEPSRSEQAVRAAVQRLGIAYPVLIDSELEVWRDYGNEGWPARYLFDGRARLFDYHHGEGGYLETELAIQELLGVQREPLAPLRPEDAPNVLLCPQTEDQPGAWSGPYEAGGVWAVLDGRGTVTVNARDGAMVNDGKARGGTPADGETRGGRTLTVEHPGAYPLVEHECHTAAVLELTVGEGVKCLATCFTPGVAVASAAAV